ncbi:MAG: tRNA pseudouridine(38-40) synthase TruA [Calditrichae bacterium]|nr:tRNA pseudouridine(38-40) synthase TruA [Calditrichota bacterium]MCB9059085.1 tRNA pseudouridine(38-40) synthase TruA [Calditrichia bacterium]
MPRIKMTIEYDGTAYSGWQIQKNAHSVQGEIENALSIIFRKEVLVTGAGRTDAGVHARNQIAHCDVIKTDLKRLRKSINGLVKKDIVVKSIELCKPDFHARFDAKSRLYKYYITRVPTALNRNFAWYISYPLDIALMNIAADKIKQISNFKSFCKAHSSNKTYDCIVTESDVFERDEVVIFKIKANRFLYGMVRALTGTLVQIAAGKMTLDDLTALADARDRTMVGLTAPASGLVLEEIEY